MLQVPVTRLTIGDVVEVDGGLRTIHAIHFRAVLGGQKVDVHFTDGSSVERSDTDRLTVTEFRPATDAEFDL